LQIVMINVDQPQGAALYRTRTFAVLRRERSNT
jgi:hypothetical protein